MDGVYSGRDYLRVKKTGYRGVPAATERKIKSNNAVVVNDKKANVAPLAKESVVRAGVRDTYRVSAKSSSAVVRQVKKASLPENTAEKAKGFVYVEHCGIAGTFKDAFFTKRVKKKEKSCFDKIVLILLFAVLMFFVAGSYCEYYEAFKTTNSLKNEISQCREEQAKLLVAIEERNNRLGIADYAENILGMVKADKLTTYYINISEKDSVNITVKDEDGYGTNGVLLSGFKSVISNFGNDD